MGIFDDVKKAKNAIDNCEKSIQNCQERYDRLIEEIHKYSVYLKQGKDFKNAWEKYLDKRVNFIKNACNYDCSEIGPIIAKLISSLEEQEYVYQKAMYKEIENLSERWGTDTDYDEYEIYLITKKETARQYYEEMKGSSYVINNSNNLILRTNNLLGNRIDFVNFYDSDLNKVVDVKGFSYVYDFIDYVVERKLEKGVFKLSQEELEGVLNEFLSTYIKEDKNKKKM